MPFRNRFKRLQGKVKGVYQARNTSGNLPTSTISLPDVLITSFDTNDLSASEIEGIRTSAPSPDPQDHTLSPSPHISAIPSLEPKPRSDKTRSTGLLPHPRASSTNFTHIYSPSDMGISASSRPPGSMLSLHQRHPTGEPTPERIAVTQAVQNNIPTTGPPPHAPSRKENKHTQFSATQPNPEATPGDTNPVTESVIPAHELDCASKSVTTAPDITQTLTWECLNKFRRVLKGVSGGFGPLGPIIDGLSDCFGIYEDAMRSRQDYQALKNELELLFSVLSENFAGDVPPTMTAAMNNLCSAIEAELDHMRTKESRGRVRQYLEADKDPGDIMQHYRSIQAHLGRLKLNADLNMWRAIDQLATETRLKSLLKDRVLAACYDSAEARELGRRECTPETRKQVLQDLGYWRRDREKGNIYWLNGMAGTGKTTIASSLCAMLDKSHELGASFFCSRLLPDCRNINFILPAISYQLARYSYPFRYALSLALQEEPDLPSKALLKQLEGLIVKPLRKVAGALPTDLVVVVDALDECDDSQGAGLFLEILVKHALELPLKVFVSSRPETRIRQQIGSTKSQLVLHELESTIVKEDIKLFLQTELEELLPSISDQDFARVVEQAGVLFIYAATVVRFIRSSASVAHQQGRLQDVLKAHTSGNSSHHTDIDTLYDTVLTSAFSCSGLQDNEKGVMKLVLDTVICAQEPLTVAAIAGLLGLDDKILVQAALEPLWSVLHIAGGEAIVTTLHASFPEYMLDLTRSKGLGCLGEQHHDRLAEFCFNRIKNNTSQFNICSLESSFIFDEQVPNLEERVTQATPQELLYACQYWAAHLEIGKPSAGRSEQLRGFLSERLLLWIEILNLRKRALIATSILSKAEAWCKAGYAPEEVRALVHDAWKLVAVFATNSVTRSTPHLYVSMLASWTSTGLLANRHIRRTKGLVRVEGTGLTRRQVGLSRNFSVGSPVHSVAFLSDNTRVICGSTDGRIHVWDAMSGQPVMHPIQGHTGQINSAAFSPDGMRIVCGSGDGTIYVLDATNGKLIIDPIEGHTEPVLSVGLSPDGMRVVCGSGSGTIYVLDATNGKLVIDPIEGHIASVVSVGFSPDGMRIVSGSIDKTICVWDATSGKLLMGPIEPLVQVSSVAFSPDGTRIVSGDAFSNAIRVCNATSGKSTTDLLMGHTRPVRSVAFSPDGMRIVSGSDDATIRVWDVTSEKLVIDPIEGHTNSVVSVGFSPDNIHIVSGSRDGTVRVWNVTNGIPVPGPLETSTHWIDSVRGLADVMDLLSVIREAAMCLWNSMRPRQMPEPAKVPEDRTVVLLRPYSRAPTSCSLQATRVQGESRWRLIRDTFGTLARVRIISGWYLPAHTLWSRSLLVFFAFGLLENPMWTRSIHLLLLCLWIFPPYPLGVQNSARELQSAAKSADAYGNRHSLVSTLLALVQLSASTSIEYLDFIDVSLSEVAMCIASRVDITARCVQDTLPKLAHVFNAHLLLPFILFGVVSRYGSPSSGLEAIPLTLLVETIRLNPWRRTNQTLSALPPPGGMCTITGPVDHEIPKRNAKGSEYVHQAKALAFSPKSMRVVSSFRDHTIRVWDATNGKPAMNPIRSHASWVSSAAFSTDDTRIVCGFRDGSILTWDATNGEPVTSSIGGHTDQVNSVAFSPDGTRIASGSEDKMVRVWDATNGKPITGPIKGHTRSVESVAFSPDGTRIMSCSLGSTIYVWDAENGTQVAQLCGPSTERVLLAAFLADSKRVVSFSNDWTARVWDTRTPKVKHNLWVLNEEGWVVDNEENLLLWLPAELRQCLLPARNLYSISADRFIALNFDEANIGESWTKCYVCA